MTIWIVTTGSSDIQLKTEAEDNWNPLFVKVRSQFNKVQFSPSLVDDEKSLTVPARVMGIVYEEQADSKDLVFPLLDGFSQELLKSSKTIPDQIIVILTDQGELFPEEKDRRLKKCPYWQDTCTLQPILESYFQKKFPQAKQDYRILKPKADSKGLDHWEQTLKLLQDTLSSLECNKGKDIYVSHQAGTPAISSAIQFVSLGKFGKRVKFLVSNEHQPNSVEVIESSTYLRGIQIQQVKGLITSGSPGAARRLIEVEKIQSIDYDGTKLDDLVNFFNLNRSGVNNGSEFEIEPATQRIVDALGLIGKFFKNDSYLQGITLLTAAQETFLKVAIVHEIKDKTLSLKINNIMKTFKASDLIQWQQAGLLFIKKPQDTGRETDNRLKNLLNTANDDELTKIKIDILKQLKFPVDKFKEKLEKYRNFNIINSNPGLLKWLRNFNPEFEEKEWALLEWTCILKDKRSEYEDDLRNQLMHNLLGVRKEEVIKYLLGNQDNADVTEVTTAYENYVKAPFFTALNFLGLKYNKEKTEKVDRKLEDVANGIR